MTQWGNRDDDLVSEVSAEPADGEEDLLDLGGRHGAPSWLVAVGIGVLVAGVIAVAVAKQAGHHHVATTLPTTTFELPSTIAPTGAGTSVDLGETSAVDLALADQWLYVLTKSPSRLGQAEAQSGEVTRQIAAPTGADRIYADRSGEMVWVVAGKVVHAYDGPTLFNTGHLRLPQRIATAAALDGKLYVSTEHGVYEMTAPTYTGLAAASVRLLPGHPRQEVQTMTADPTRHRLFAVTAGYELLEVTTRGVRSVRQLQGQLPSSIEVTRSGIWIVGFGNPGGTRLGRLDPATLRITPVGSNDADAPQGADGWAGTDVFWMRYAYSDSLTCRDGRSGAVVATLNGVDGPVQSVHGAAYGIRGGKAVRLATTSRCPG